MNNRSDINPTEWGRTAWDFIDYVVKSYPDSLSDNQTKEVWNFFRGLTYVLPCASCRKGFGDKMMNTKFSIFGTKEGILNWLKEVRNSIVVSKEQKGGYVQHLACRKNCKPYPDNREFDGACPIKKLLFPFPGESNIRATVCDSSGRNVFTKNKNDKWTGIDCSKENIFGTCLNQQILDWNINKQYMPNKAQFGGGRLCDNSNLIFLILIFLAIGLAFLFLQVKVIMK